MPETLDELIFKLAKGLPNIIGFTDCTHVKIYSPGGEGLEVRV